MKDSISGRVIIAGSRDINCYEELEDIIKVHKRSITEVVCGMALHWKWKDDPLIGGVDRLGYRWAKKHGIAIAEFPAHWTTYGKEAGDIRNAAMAQYGDSLFVLWDGVSKGTRNMIQTMRKMGKPLEVHVRNHPDNGYTPIYRKVKE